MKRIFTALMASAILWSCTQEVEDMEVIDESIEFSLEVEIIPKEKIDEMIINTLKTKNEFNWSELNDVQLWSALVHADSILTVGYIAKGETHINERITSIDISEQIWESARLDIVEETRAVLAQKRKEEIKAADLPNYAHEVLPFLEMKVYDLEVINRLRSLENVRYVEPLGYVVNFETYGEGGRFSDSGCSNEPNYNIAGLYTDIAPGAKMSWNYPQMGIDQAWNHSTGAGITIGMIDTGLAPNQAKLGSQFNSGYSQNRTVERYGTYQTGSWWWKKYDGPDDKCGHGTSMAGVATAPRSNDGSAVGVAYNANLVGIRGTSDVVVNGGNEKDGVTDALVYLGSRSDVKIISMSIGDVFNNSKVADGIRYAYGRGKLIFAAAGTSTTWTNWYGVIFPANMNETVAVTGVKEGQYTRCNT